MTRKILVTYATRAGSTAEIAAAMGETLAARGFSVEVKPVAKVTSLNGYQAVLLGSAIRMGSWLPEMVKFIQTHQPALNALPTALFTVHMLNTDDDQSSRAARAAYTAPVRALLPNAPEVFFSGVIDLEKLSLLDRLMVKTVKPPIGDYRDWKQIRGWAESLLSPKGIC